MRINTKLAWAVAAAVVWAWAGLFAAVVAPEHAPPQPMRFGFGEGRDGIRLPGRLAELIEDEAGVHIALEDPALGRDGPRDHQRATPELPEGIDVHYVPPADNPQPPRIEVMGGNPTIHPPSGGLLVGARGYIFRINKDSVRILPAPPGGPFREHMRERMEERRGGRHPFLEQRHGERDGGPRGPPPDGAGRGERRDGPAGPPPDDRREPPPGDRGGPPPGNNPDGERNPPPERAPGQPPR